MAEVERAKKRSSRRERSKKPVEEKTVEGLREVRFAPRYEPQMLPLRLLVGGAIVKDTGPVTGQEYTFLPGQITLVDERDYPHLLARQTKSVACCGGRSRQPQQRYGAA